MQDLSRLLILFIVAANLAGWHAVDGAAAAAFAALAAGWGLARAARLVPPPGRRQHWQALLTRHRIALTRRYRQLVRPNPYGYEETDRWQDELERFRLSTGLTLDGRADTAFDRLATATARRWAERDDAATLEAGGELTPADYEEHCAALLRRHGWRASVTGMSGDQGADVVAERDGVSIALQCKLYAQPVGNKAVQEAHAAAGFVDASLAGVVTNADFTRSAEALAHKLGVLLLHHSDLTRLEEHLAGHPAAT